MEKKSSYPLLDRLNGIKHVVLGNHDRRQDVPHLLQHVESVVGMIQYKGIMLTHCPMHPMELEYRFNKNIHGHIHDKVVMKMLDGWEVIDERYFCVSCEQVDYKPKTLEELNIER
jgi:calcineurin-like phosphoesterase family protein